MTYPLHIAPKVRKMLRAILAMRVRPLFSFFLVTGSAALSVHCTSGTAETGRGDQAIVGTNPIGLRLTFHEPSSSLRAKTKQPLLPDDKLVLRVRPGHLDDTPPPFHCQQLPTAPPVPEPPP